MKKRVLCIFSIIFFLLIGCTMLSFKIEDEMMTVVKASRLSLTGQLDLPTNVLFYDDFGRHLYGLEEGTGWESGQRVLELGNSDYSVDESVGKVRLTAFQLTHVITTATRQPIEGSEVIIVKEANRLPDDLLLYYPGERTTSESFPVGVTMTALSNHAMLLSAEMSPQPYTEHQAKGWLDLQAMPQWRIYSLTEVNNFLGNMPMVALVAVMMLAGVILWGYSCILARDSWQNRGSLWINTAIAVAILCCLPLVLNAIDLPPSMLPTENILDFNHYRTEFTQLFDALRGLGDCSQAKNVLQKADESLYASLGILFAGILSCTAVIIIESIFTHRKKKQ